jgi:hypothetical protein
MKKIKKILEERVSGLFLLMFALLIIIGISSNSPKAESKNDRSLTSKNQISGENQILGEMSSNSGEITNEDSSVSQDEIIKENASENESQINPDNFREQKKEDVARKKSNKKSKKHKNSSNNNSSKSDETFVASAPAEAASTLDFIINSGSGTEKFTMEFKEGETVYELMKEAKAQGKLKYEKNTDETYGIYINEINGLKEGSDGDWTKNKYWILYVSGKSSSLGCSSHKLTKSDTSIEWKYEKYSF